MFQPELFFSIRQIACLPGSRRCALVRRQCDRIDLHSQDHTHTVAFAGAGVV
jgi:hypothetical protein